MARDVEDFWCFPFLEHVYEVALSEDHALENASVQSCRNRLFYRPSLLHERKLGDRISSGELTAPGRLLAENDWRCEEESNVCLLLARVPIHLVLSL